MKQTTEIHRYYEIIIMNGFQLVLKRNYNTKIYSFDRILEELKHYPITETQYTIKRIKMSKEEYLETLNS